MTQGHNDHRASDAPHFGHESSAGPAPLIRDFDDPIEFLRLRLEHRRRAQPGFSVSRACRELPRCSPALVSMILKRERSLSPDRADDLARLMGLSARERVAFREWVESVSQKRPRAEEGPADGSESSLPRPLTGSPAWATRRGWVRAGLQRKEVSRHLLKDWINPYVKDAFRFESIQKNPESVLHFLEGLASPERLRRSVAFLLREGYLRRTLDGRIVEDTPLTVTDENLPHEKIRSFHRHALQLARDAVEAYPPERRLANAFILPVSEQSQNDVLELIAEFTEKLKRVAEEAPDNASQLYQLVINLSPVSGRQA